MLQRREQEKQAISDMLKHSLEENKEIRKELENILDSLEHGQDPPAAAASAPEVETKLRGEIAGYKAVLEQQELHVQHLEREWAATEANLRSQVSGMQEEISGMEEEAGKVRAKISALESLVGEAEAGARMLERQGVERLETFMDKEAETAKMEGAWFMQVGSNVG